MIAYSHRTVTRYFPIPNSVCYYWCSYIFAHASLQSIYSKFKGRLATHFRSNSFDSYANRDLIITSTNGLKFRILFSRRRSPQRWSQTRLPRRTVGDRLLRTHCIIENYFFVAPYNAVDRKRLLAEVLSPRPCATGHRRLIRADV